MDSVENDAGPVTARNETEAAILSRRSVRGFRPDPIPREVVEHLLDVAARAPSGSNMQPWRVVALAGAELARLCDGVVTAFEAGSVDASDYDYYPSPMFEPYLGRQREIGWALYGLLGIARGERAKARAHVAWNLRFFGAPVGLICVIDRRLRIGSWLDYGMFLENIAIAARAAGLDSCPMAVFAQYPRTIRHLLGLPDSDVVICGMALGREDTAAPANALRTARVPARTFASFRGF
jgi:nitroreductase